MAENNEIAPLVKMMGRMLTRMEDNEKKMELITMTLQTLIKNILMKNGEKSCNEEWEDKGNRRAM